MLNTHFEKVQSKPGWGGVVYLDSTENVECAGTKCDPILFDN